MKTWTREEDLGGRPACRCRACGQLIVDVPEVGWVDPDPGSGYDLCAEDRLGNHQPHPGHLRPFGDESPTVTTNDPQRRSRC